MADGSTVARTIKLSTNNKRSSSSFKPARGHASNALFFLVKVAGLELIRQGSRKTCPKLWWGLQGIFILQAPPFVWLQRWAPFRWLIRGSHIFSKPMLFLSLVTAITSISDKDTKEDSTLPKELERSPSLPSSSIIVHSQESVRSFEPLSELQQELKKEGVIMSDRIFDELEKFLVAANGDIRKCVLGIKKSIRWRETFYFFPPAELEAWSKLVCWHHRDSHGRPILVMRLGLGSSLPPSERPRFVQAVVSQIEFGILNLLNSTDPRITVLLDCSGTPAVGFPIQMTKSSCRLIQENYPTRLAALWIINLSPVLRMILNTIIQVLKPATREKVFIGKDLLVDHLGGIEFLPLYLGGGCKCDICLGAQEIENTTISPRPNSSRLQSVSSPLIQNVERDEFEFTENTNQNWTSRIRFAIIVLLMFWFGVALVVAAPNSSKEKQ